MSQRNIYISYLRVIATIAVVAIHASTGFLNRFHAYSFDWNYANWINSFSRCAVPVFVAISGILLLSKEENINDFYKKRMSKIMLPFAFWTIVYIIYYFLRINNFDQLSSQRIVDLTYQKVLQGANAHLWYLYMIVGLYLAVPFIRKIVQGARIRDIEYFLAFWLLASFLKHQFIREHFFKIDLTFFTGYVGYLILGYYISIKTIHWSKIYTLILYCLGGALTAMATYYLSSSAKKYDPTFYNYLTPNTIFITAMLLILGRQLWEHKVTMPTWMRIVDQYSFGIYLVHIIPLNYLHPWWSKYLSTGLLIPVATVTTVASSVLIIYLLRCIPGGKYISG